MEQLTYPHAKSELDLLNELKTSAEGLQTQRAQSLLQTYGFNRLTLEKKTSPLIIFIRQFLSPLVFILLGAIIISLVLQEYADAIVIGIIIVLNSVLGFVQEYRAEQAVEALQKLAAPKAKVKRDNTICVVDSELIVPGDIITIEAGDKVPADSRLLEVHDLRIEEAALTGESVPSAKKTGTLPEKTSVADQKNMIFSSTIVANGRATALVVRTGMNTEVGKIANLIAAAPQKMTPLQVELEVLGKQLTIGVILVCLLTFGAGILTGQPMVAMILTAIALAVAAIPEGLPAIITISLALGVNRMSKRNALVRKLPSVETLGAVDVICTDKTGTLTKNEMTVVSLWYNNEVYTITGTGYDFEGKFLLGKNEVKSDLLYPLLRVGAFCNDARFQTNDKKRTVLGDPTEAALIVSAEKAKLAISPELIEAPRVDEIPFTSERKMMTTIHQLKKSRISYTKGAPEIVLNKCTLILQNGKFIPLTDKIRKTILTQSEVFATEALRVLGFAYKEKVISKEDAERDMIFIGLQAMMDPPRIEVRDAIIRCKDAGIRVVMITGDHVITAQAIAHKLGIEGKAVTGEELDKNNLDEKIKEISIFARVNPEHKLKIVDALKKQGHIVAMTGDGVNDAPALKRADIGVAMGITGTDVAKEAADMILVDDNFTSIVNAIEEGRGIFDNIRKFVDYLLSSNLGEIVLILIATLIGLPTPLTAIQILWVNLVTDGLPAIALSVDPAEKDIMKRPPHKGKEEILNRHVLFTISMLGILLGLITLGLFVYYYNTSTLIKAQTVAFTALAFFEIVRLQLIRSEYNLGILSNKALLIAVGASFALQLAVIYTPLSTFFGVEPLVLKDWLIIIGAAGIMIAITKVIQIVKKREIHENKVAVPGAVKA